MKISKEQHFWNVLERDLNYEIPNFIKNGFTWLSFANPISFSGVTDYHIDKVEEYIKNKALNDVANLLEESVDGECSFLLDDEQMIDIFGPRHASEPSEFRFEIGDRSLIQAIVEKVKKMVDLGGELTNLGHFDKKRKKKCTKSLLPFAKPKRPNNRATSKCEESIETLHSKLFKRVAEYLNDLNVDTTQLKNDMIVVEPNRIIGKIHCMFCKAIKKKSKPKRVYYHKGTRSTFWTISNFQTHCENVHPSIAAKRVKKTATKAKQSVKIDAVKSAQLNDSDNLHATIESNAPKSKESSESSVGITNKSLDLIVIESDTESMDLQADNNNNDWSGVESFTNQLQKVAGFILLNGDVQHQMVFDLEDRIDRYLSVVCTKGDGNCLFSALTHQLFGSPIDSTEHVNNTNSLRAAVVAHILIPENFHQFRYTLQDRVYEIENKKKSQIPNLEQKCKDFVSNRLSKPGEWGGMETIKAVSNMYRTNVVIFNENGPCYTCRSGETDFDQTILIAYRYGLNGRGRQIYNHYDSVSDMDPDDVRAVANFLLIKGM